MILSKLIKVKEALELLEKAFSPRVDPVSNRKLPGILGPLSWKQVRTLNILRKSKLEQILRQNHLNSTGEVY